MTDNEIVKALECCLLSNTHQEEDCNKCPLEDTPYTICQNLMAFHSLALINRQKAEIERLKAALNCYEETSGNKKAKTDAVKEFAERLKTGAVLDDDLLWVTDVDIDNLVKEFTEGGNGET